MWWRLAVTGATAAFMVVVVLSIGFSSEVEIQLPTETGLVRAPAAEPVTVWILRALSLAVSAFIGWIAFWMGRRIVRSHGSDQTPR